MIGGALVATLWAGAHVSASADAPPVPPSPPAAVVYTNPAAPVEARVEDLLGRLTLPEKFSLLALEAPEALRLNTPPIPRLGVPSLRTCDAPEGLRDGPATAFPMGVVTASTWNPNLARLEGAAIAEEARAKNRQVIYGPDVNIQRSPQGGRGFECYSEDPYLSARMGVAHIEGMQGRGVAACVKHLVCNDQEYERQHINVVVGERALHEIYLPPFQAAVEQAHVWTLMDSLNQINGTYASQSRPLLTDLVKTAWKWDGLVISDWGGIHSTADAANAGTDMEMPAPRFYAPDALGDALDKKLITQAVIDDMVRRVLRVMVRTGLLDGPKPPDPAAVNSPAHQKLALKVAQEGMILLKNAHNVLPLDRRTIKSIAVIGSNAQDTQLGGRWSASVQPFYSVSVLDGIKKLALPTTTVQFAEGCPRTGGSSPAGIRAAAALAAKADVAVVVVGMDSDYEGEALDPPNINLPGDQDALVQAVAAANKNTIVVLNQGTPILMDRWLGQVSGVLESWYAGQEQGNAVAGILFGDVNPSGKLTETIGARREDYSDFGNYPGTDDVMTYGEGIYVGYRHFDKAKITPLFPFGFGLSYTTFSYSALKVPSAIKPGQPAMVRLTVQNTGLRAGDEIVQLYVHDLAPKTDKPVQELKGFHRVSLQPGRRVTVSLPLDPDAFAYWDVTRHRWKADPGRYELRVGSSSRDIRLRGVVRLP